MHLGCIFSPARNSVWVYAFLVWKVHKGQNSRFVFLSPITPLPHPEEKFHQPRIWPERKQLGTRAPENSSLSITEEAAAASHTKPALLPVLTVLAQTQAPLHSHPSFAPPLHGPKIRMWGFSFLSVDGITNSPGLQTPPFPHSPFPHSAACKVHASVYLLLLL